ncbi:M23 family metallopeptidase [Agromyces protaetiae]|nr:M23 family metallopeptidase [Agromyces protaetiae]
MISVAAGLGALALVFGGIAPAQAGETEPTPTAEQPTDPPPPDPPIDPPVDPPTDPPVDPPTDPPVDPPTDPPVDPPTDPPVDPPVDPPTDPPATTPPATTPPATTTPPTTTLTTTQPPRPTTPAPVATGSTRLVLTGSGPFLQIGTQISPDVSALLTARATVDAIESELRDAQADLKDVRAQQGSARTTAERLGSVAYTARLKAGEATRASMASARTSDAAMNSIGAAFGAGKDLLAGLAGVQRVAQLSGDSERLLEIAGELDALADEAEARAADAWAEVDKIPVGEKQKDVSDTETTLASAEADLKGLQEKVQKANVAFVDSLPLDNGQLSEQGWSAPVRGRVTDGFGPRPNKPLASVNEFHRGTDIAAPCTSAVFAATAGTVLQAGPDGGYGNWILLDHGSGVQTGYAHLANGGILVSVGEHVEAGQVIGAVGSTGQSTGCHLHFEVRLGGTAVDSLPFLAARGVAVG